MLEDHVGEWWIASAEGVSGPAADQTQVSSVSWVTITSFDVGIGNGSITYMLAANPGVSGRNGTIIIGGKALGVKQKAG